MYFMKHSSIDFYSEFDEDINQAIIETYAFIHELPKDKHYKIMVVDVEPIRNLSQNNYYWVLLTILEDHTGHDKYELHRDFARLFNMEIEVTKRNELLVFGGSTTEQKEKAFRKYLDNIRLFALEMMGVTEKQLEKAIPPRNRVTEELLWKCGIET